MAACEICWEKAARDVIFLGGSVSERYQKRIAEEEQNPTHVPETLEDRIAKGEA